jgi:uncharacterized membrane protein YphA (DoxX/SURF4 family)
LLELVGGIALILGLFVGYLGLLYTIEFIVVAFWVKLPTQGYAAARLDFMILAGAAGAVLSRRRPLVDRLNMVRKLKPVEVDEFRSI